MVEEWRNGEMKGGGVKEWRDERMEEEWRGGGMEK